MIDRWHEVEQLCAAALEIESSARAAFLDARCGDDTGLRREVESLLAYAIAEPAFLERPALMEAATRLADDPRPSLVGQQIGGYQILSLLGAGGMGEVYLARDLKLGREAALKVLARFLTGDPSYLRRFEEEARLASFLNHPNIVTVYGIGEDGDITYMAMELVRGRTLRETSLESPLSLEVILDRATQLAGALAAAHEAGIVHRDLKPENVMVTATGLIKVLDFGLARRHGGALSMTSPEKTMFGSAGYMSPEQIAGSPAGPLSDQFSFGVMLYEMLAGRRAFVRSTAADTLSAILHEQPDAIDTVNTDVSVSLKRAVERCLMKDPAARFRDMRELEASLRNSVAAPRGFSRRHAMALGAGSAVAGIAALASRRFWTRHTDVRSLAVLPFTHAANDEDTAYLGDGLTDGLIRRMSQLRSLSVMARSTVLNFKNKTIDARAAGRQLSVDAVLTGTIARKSGRLIVSAELVDVATGAQLWSDRYDRAPTDLFAMEDEIASAIVDNAIRLRLTADERRQLVHHPTENAAAFDFYVRAMSHIARETEEDYLSARRLLQQAIDMDPKFAFAYRALGSTYAVMAIDGYERPTDAWPLANRYVGEALALDPDSADAHAEVASAAFFFNWDWAGAEREWKAAMQSRVNKVEPDLLMAGSLKRWALGQPYEALALARDARRRDPLTIGFKVREADLLVETGQLDTAAALYDECIRTEPRDPRAYFGLAEAKQLQGRFDEAIDVRRRGHREAGDESMADLFAAARGEEGYRTIEQASARAQLTGLEQRAAGAYASPLDFARVHAVLGHTTEVFRLMEVAFADRAPGLVFLNVDRAWRNVRSDSRFALAVRRVGLPIV
jgi:serine/threonine-protein kinase